MTWNNTKPLPRSYRVCRTGRQVRRFRPLLELLESRLSPSVDVLSWRGAVPGNNSGVNANETQLTPSTVSAATFGQLFNDPVDGTIYGEPLVKTGVSIGGVRHNVVYVATEHDSVYAFDANTAGPALWHDSFINPAAGINVVPSAVTQSGDIAPEIGISNTMFIDAATGTLYTTSKTQNTVNGVNHYVIQLHALNIATGAEKFGGPVTIGDTTIGGPDGGYTDNTNVSIPGTGDGSNGTVVKFNALRENERDGLFEDTAPGSTGLLYLTFTSHGDVAPTHGWILGYNPTTLQLQSVFNTAPNGFDTAIWMGQGMPAMDANGVIYAATGNGVFDVFTPGPNALGGGGGALGYQGIGNSVAIKFDLFNNEGEGSNSTGIFFNGDFPGLPHAPGEQSIDLTSSGINLHSGDHFSATLAYDNTAHTLTETITDLDATGHPTFTQTYNNVNLTSQLAGNTGFVGFTGGTGGLTAVQNVNTWMLTAGGSPVLNYANFNTPTNLTANGSAKFTGGSAELTDGGGGEAGSVFFNTPVNVSGGFTTNFTFQLTNANADGMTFTIQNAQPGPDYAESVLKIDATQNSANGNMKVVSSFTPSDQQALSNADLDQGSGGVLLLPDSVGSAAHRHLMVQTGKEGEVYLIDRDNLGGYNTNPNGPDNVVQVLPPGTVIGGSFDTPAYFNGKIYYMGTGDVLKAFSISNGVINPIPVAQTGQVLGFTGASPFITTSRGEGDDGRGDDGNGNDGIVWVLDNHLHGTNGATDGPSVLHAYDANTLKELYTSSQFSTDKLGGAVKFSVPTVANGKAYVPTQNGLYVFGLLRTGRTVPPVLQVAACSSEADLSWTATANDHYDILESTDGVHFTRIASVDADVTTFKVQNLSPNKYFFEVKAFNEDSTPAFSNIVHAFVGEATVIDQSTGFADHSDLIANGNATFSPNADAVGTFAGHQDIGGVGAPGSATFDNGTGTYTLNASSGDIWNAADSFQFAYRPLVGDGTIIARATHIDATDFWAKGGVMMRESLDAGSRNVFMFETPNLNGIDHNEPVFQWRTDPLGGTSDSDNHVMHEPPAPIWLELVRQGNNFSGFWALDINGAPGTFNQLGPTVTENMPSQIFVGLALTGQGGKSNTSTFDHLTVTPATAPLRTPAARLTDGGFGEAGSIFSTQKLDVRKFNTTFTFQFAAGTNPIADGMAFVIQGNSPTALGGGGGGLGYQGIPNSVAVTLRAFNPSTQIGLGVNGSFQGQVSITGMDFNAAAQSSPPDTFQVTLTYDGTTLNATIQDLTTHVSFTAPAQTINIPALVGGETGFVGFSAGTGGLTLSADVLTWNYTPTSQNLPPLSPSNLKVVNVTTHDANRDDVDLSWVCHSFNETGFVVQRSTDGLNFTTIATLPPNSTSYRDLMLQPGTYYYRVYAFNGNGNSLLSNIDSVLLGAPRDTTTVDHSGGFASHGDLTNNGSATFTGTLLRLTDGNGGEAGSAFTTSRVLVSNFDTSFTFQMHDGTNPSADGMAFVLQGSAPSALGGAGGGLGYGSDHPGGPQGIPNSIAIKFDLFSNAGEGVNSTGIFFNGDSPTVPSQFGDCTIDLTSFGIDLHSQDVFQVHLTYDGTRLIETITDQTSASHPTFTHSYTVNIPSFVGGNVGYSGFTGGTGGLTTVADVKTWTYSFVEPGPGEGGDAAAHGSVLGGHAGTGGSGSAPAAALLGPPAPAQALPTQVNGSASGGSDSGTFAGAILFPWNQALNGTGVSLLTPGQQSGFVTSTGQPGSSPVISSISDGGTGAVAQLEDPAANGPGGAQPSAADIAVLDDVFNQTELSNAV